MPDAFRCLWWRQGYTFNEVLVAMLICSVAVLGYAASTVGVIRAHRANHNYTVAVNLAQDKLEQLRALPALNDENHCPAAGESGLSAAGSIGGVYDRCWSIRHSHLGENLKQIVVTVSWRDGVPGAVTLETLVYRD